MRRRTSSRTAVAKNKNIWRPDGQPPFKNGTLNYLKKRFALIRRQLPTVPPRFPRRVSTTNRTETAVFFRVHSGMIPGFFWFSSATWLGDVCQYYNYKTNRRAHTNDRREASRNKTSGRTKKAQAAPPQPHAAPPVRMPRSYEKNHRGQGGGKPGR